MKWGARAAPAVCDWQLSTGFIALKTIDRKTCRQAPHVTGDEVKSNFNELLFSPSCCNFGSEYGTNVSRVDGVLTHRRAIDNVRKTRGPRFCSWAVAAGRTEVC